MVPVRRRDGFSLVELLLSSAILVVLLAAGAALLSGTSRVHRTTIQITDAEERIDAITRIVRRDLSMAGFRGTDGTGELLGDGRAFVAPTEDGRLTGELVVRYVEEMYADSATSQEVAYRVSDGVLTRRVGTSAGSGTPVDLLGGVDRIDVATFDGGVRLDIRFDDEAKPIPIVARFPQALEDSE